MFIKMEVVKIAALLCTVGHGGRAGSYLDSINKKRDCVHIFLRCYDKESQNKNQADAIYACAQNRDWGEPWK